MKTDTFPIQGKETYTGELVRIPWTTAELAYREYSRRYGTQQTLERMAERGGFGVWEIIDLLASQLKL